MSFPGPLGARGISRRLPHILSAFGLNAAIAAVTATSRKPRSPSSRRPLGAADDLGAESVGLGLAMHSGPKRNPTAGNVAIRPNDELASRNANAGVE